MNLLVGGVEQGENGEDNVKLLGWSWRVFGHIGLDELPLDLLLCDFQHLLGNINPSHIVPGGCELVADRLASAASEIQDGRIWLEEAQGAIDDLLQTGVFGKGSLVAPGYLIEHVFGCNVHVGGLDWWFWRNGLLSWSSVRLACVIIYLEAEGLSFHAYHT